MTACSLHPLPEDYSGNKTFDVVQRIRCEARAGVLSEIAKFLKTSSAASTKSLASNIENEPPTLGEFMNLIENDESFDPKVRDKIYLYYTSSISFGFLFNITENDDQSVGANFKLPISNTNLTLGVSAGSAFQRENKRSFDIADTFPNLFTEYLQRECSNFDLEAEDATYPVTGRIGLDETIGTFVKLQEFAGGVRNYTEKLTFTTTLNGSIKPKLTLSPGIQGLELVDADGSLGARAFSTKRDSL